MRTGDLNSCIVGLSAGRYSAVNSSVVPGDAQAARTYKSCDAWAVKVKDIFGSLPAPYCYIHRNRN